MAILSGWLQFVAVAVFLFVESSAWIFGGDHSKHFDRCTSVFDTGVQKEKFTKVTYEQECMDLLLPRDGSNQRIGNFTDEQVNYLQHLFRKIYTEAYRAASNRVKRGIQYAGDVEDRDAFRVRTEIRYLGGQNYRRFATAVQRIKKSGAYDIIADVHSTVVKTAHFGPNFLPWHRLYLLVFETALGCAVPYWDSSLEFNMKDPTTSIVWTDKYFGNGVGAVVTGPFAHFKTPAGPLFRKINADGQLVNRQAVSKFIFSKRRLAEISSPLAKPLSNIEGVHNNVHAWINGIMGNLAISTYDPIFFLIHANLDAMYDIFRWQQQASGINPEFDTVKTDIPGQRPDDRAGINGYHNRDGYLNKNSKRVVYRLWALCGNCDGSPDLYCDAHLGECVAKSVKQQPITVKQLIEADELARKSGLAYGRFGAAFTAFSVDPRVRGDSVQNLPTIQIVKH